MTQNSNGASKNSNRLKILLFTLTLLLSLSFILPTFALSPGSDKILGDTRTAAGFPDATDTTVSQIAGVYIKMALSLIGTIFLVLTIYAGILWMTAAGNDEQITKSTGILKSALIGFIIVSSAYSLTGFILSGGTPHADPAGAGGGACDLGKWDYDREKGTASDGWNKGAHNAVCGLKGAAQTVTGTFGAIADMFTFFQFDLAEKATDY